MGLEAASWMHGFWKKTERKDLRGWMGMESKEGGNHHSGYISRLNESWQKSERRRTDPKNWSTGRNNTRMIRPWPPGCRVTLGINTS